MEPSRWPLVALLALLVLLAPLAGAKKPEAKGAEPQPAACPATAPVEGAPCGATRVDAIDTCRYPEASCRCGFARSCSGMARVDPPREEWVWLCTPKVRADGCPGEQPKTGDACQVKHACSYENGCQTTTFPCTHGRFGKREDSFRRVP